MIYKLVSCKDRTLHFSQNSLVRGVPTGAAAEPLKSRFLEDGDPPAVWPYAEGKVRGISLAPLYKGVPRAALRDPQFYGVLALCDAIRSGRTRERNLAIELLMQGDQCLRSEPAVAGGCVNKLAPFLDEIVFVGGVTLGLLITDKAAAPIRWPGHSFIEVSSSHSQKNGLKLAR